MNLRLVEYEETDSTNEAAKRLVRDAENTGLLQAGEVYGYVITAKRQTAGKGRRGKSFFSPGGDSIYASFILPPPENPAEQQITTLAGAAVCEAIKKASGRQDAAPTIRGVNDVLVEGRKVCGILTEGIPGAVIIGIGININLEEEDFPEELRDSAGSLRLTEEERERLFKSLADAMISLKF